MDINGIRTYMAKMFPVAASLGVETIVFGNGGIRSVPKGETYENTWQTMRVLAELMEEYASLSGLEVLIEPLNTKETDMINSYGEAVKLTEGLTCVAAMVDNYHAAMENQSSDDVLENPEKLRHLHIAYPTGRFIPSPEDDVSCYAEFVSAVKQVGYNGKISIEGKLRGEDCFCEIEKALGVMKGLFG